MPANEDKAAWKSEYIALLDKSTSAEVQLLQAQAMKREKAPAFLYRYRGFYTETRLEDGGCVVDHRRSRWLSRYPAGDFTPVVPTASDYLHPDNAFCVPFRFTGSEGVHRFSAESSPISRQIGPEFFLLEQSAGNQYHFPSVIADPTPPRWQRWMVLGVSLLLLAGCLVKTYVPPLVESGVRAPGCHLPLRECPRIEFS